LDGQPTLLDRINTATSSPFRVDFVCEHKSALLH
jgi:hypothetical protein